MLVHNDFHKSHGLFTLFEGLEVDGLDQPYEVKEATNGVSSPNGVSVANGTDRPFPVSHESRPLNNGVADH